MPASIYDDAVDHQQEDGADFGQPSREPPAQGRLGKDLRAGHPPEPLRQTGRYRFYLVHRWSTTLLTDGNYRLEVEASDLNGNTGALHLPFTITNNL